VYLDTTYYERWLAGLERLLVENGFISEDEMAAFLDGWRPQPGVPPVRVNEDEVQSLDDEVTPRFAPGDPVRVSNVHSAGHTRVPRYVRGRQGIVERFLSAQVLPDDLVSGRGVRQRPVYAVRFEARELWGPTASARDTVLIDLWEDYLLPDNDAGEQETP
jgi:nitrile hydratase